MFSVSHLHVETLPSASTPHTLQIDFHHTSVSVVNALRRTILSDIPTVGFREGDPNNGIASTITMEKNISCLHNEFLKHRISLLPLHLDPKDFPTENRYRFLLHQRFDEHRAVNGLMDVTTEHITGEIRSGDTWQPLPETQLRQFFPPNERGDYILLTQLRKRTPEEEIQIVFTPTLGTAKQHSGFSPVCKCTYWNMLDEEAIEQERALLQKEEDRLNFENHGKYRLYQKDVLSEEANAFHFEIESIGVLSPQTIFRTAIDVLISRLQQIQLMQDRELFSSSIPPLQEMYAVDVKMETYCHTIGNLLQCFIYDTYLRDPTRLTEVTYVGYKKPHPLDNHIVLRLVLQRAAEWSHDEYIEQVESLLQQQAGELIKYLEVVRTQAGV